MTSKTARIVIIEDNPGDVLLIEKALKAKHIASDLTCFEDGQKAIQCLAKGEAPDLVVLDLNLPKVEGIEVLKMIRSTPRLSDVPVVVFTSSESSADRQRTARLGATRFITKPSGLDDFLRVAGKAVEVMLCSDGQ